MPSATATRLSLSPREEAAEGESLLGGRRRGSDKTEQQTQESRRAGPDDIAARQHGRQRDTQHGQHEEQGLANEHERSGQRDGQGQPEGTDEATGH